MRLRRTATVLVAGLLASGLGLTQAQAAAPDGTPQLDLADTVAGATGDVVLAWDRVPGAIGYTVAVALDAGFTSVVETTNTAALRWTPTSRLAGSSPQTYYWKVTAYGTSTSDWGVDNVSEVGTFDRSAADAPVQSAPADASVVHYPAPTTFRWQPVAGATGYTLEYGTASDLNGATSQTTTATTFTPTSLLSRTATYYWRVTASLGSAKSNASAIQSFTIDWPGSAPTLLTPADGSTMSDVEFTWAPVSGASAYALDLATTPDFSSGLVLSGVKVFGTRYANDTALNNATYWWRVTPLDANSQQGTASATREFRRSWGAQTGAQVTDPTILNAPDVTSAYPVPRYVDADREIPSSSSSSSPAVVPVDQLELSWSPLARATYYELQVINSDTGSFTTAGSELLTCYTPYTSATVTTVFDQTKGTTDGQARLKFGSYCLKKSGSTELVAGDAFRWRVRAVDLVASSTATIQATGQTKLTSAWSDPEQFGVPQEQAYLQLTSASLTPGAGSAPELTSPAYDASVHQAPTLRWKPVSGSAGYLVEVALDASFTNLVVQELTPQPLLRVNGALTDNTTVDAYYWRVYACTTLGSSLTSSTCSGVANSSRFKKTSSALTMNPASIDSVGDAVGLSWAPPSVADDSAYDGASRGYEVQVSTVSDFSSTVWTAKIDQQFVETQVSTRKLDSGTYYARVRPLNAAGIAGSWSDVISFVKTVPAPTPNSVMTDASAPNLTWTPTASAQSYDVNYRKVGATTWTSITGKQAAAWTVPGLDAGSYEWQVRAKNGAGSYSAYSSTGTFTIGADAPTLSTPDASTFALDDRVLTWQPVSGAASYQVQTSTSSGFGASVVSVSTPQTSLALRPATGSSNPYVYGTTYYWRINALNSAGKVVATSSTRSFSVTTAPGTPALGSPTSSGTSITAAWTALSGTNKGTDTAPWYALRYRVTGSSDDWTQVTTASGATSITVTNLALGTSYDFQLAAVNDEGRSQWSAVKSKVTQDVPNAPTISSLTAGTGTIKVGWNAPGAKSGAATVTGYRLRYQLPDDNWSAPVTVTSGTKSYTFSGLTESGTYTVELIATSAAGDSPSAVGFVDVTAPPSSPMSVGAVAGTSAVTVSWQPPESDGGSAVTGYVVEKRSVSPSTSSWSAAGSPAASARSLKVTGLTNGTTYEFRVSAKSAAGTGTPSAAVRAKPTGKPGKVTGLKGTAKAGHKVALTWKAPANNGAALTSYTVQYKVAGGSWKTLKTVKNAKFTYTGKKGKAYYFRVRATNAKGAGAYSAYVKVTAK